MTLIFEHDNRLVVYAVKSLLESNGIECYLKNEHAQTMSVELGMSNAYLELYLLHDQDNEKARVLLVEHFQQEVQGADWRCEQCHSENDAGFNICWNCQASVIGE